MNHLELMVANLTMKKNIVGAFFVLLLNPLNAQFTDAKSLMSFSKSDFTSKIEILKKKGWVSDMPLRKTSKGKSITGYKKKTENGNYSVVLTKFTLPDSKKVVNITDLYFPYDDTFSKYFDELSTIYNFSGVQGMGEGAVGYSEKNLMILVKMSKDSYSSKWIQEIEITSVKDSK
ncbi:hypothetical protein [Chryseobacterium indologenes]|uniref:Uncharacterized protein n=1 Tax=Chryseobacterium indologenes TaxID=253 RepID=A0A0N0IV05_CHRID|nr:hypothetical protein [Chryseobacterium indologenes]KPE50113.1 hypothetical protein AOB46_16880 [Chryseobacterium indologenes]